jgi:restriction endonuclease Mrr
MPTMPKFRDLTIPLLQLADKGCENNETARLLLGRKYKRHYRSGVHVFGHRIRLAKLYLTKAKLLRSTSNNGGFRITKRGQLFLKARLRIDEDSLPLFTRWNGHATK